MYILFFIVTMGLYDLWLLTGKLVFPPQAVMLVSFGWFVTLAAAINLLLCFRSNRLKLLKRATPKGYQPPGAYSTWSM